MFVAPVITSSSYSFGISVRRNCTALSPPHEETSTALLRRNAFTKTRSPVTLTSNHARCSHFVTDGLCSTPLTNADVLWMESVSECKPGTLFKQFHQASREPSSACELPWDPMSRYTGLASAGALRTPRGHKSLDHL